MLKFRNRFEGSVSSITSKSLLLILTKNGRGLNGCSCQTESVQKC